MQVKQQILMAVPFTAEVLDYFFMKATAEFFESGPGCS
jgi:hypothetical protein